MPEERVRAMNHLFFCDICGYGEAGSSSLSFALLLSGFQPFLSPGCQHQGTSPPSVAQRNFLHIQAVGEKQVSPMSHEQGHTALLLRFHWGGREGVALEKAINLNGPQFLTLPIPLVAPVISTTDPGVYLSARNASIAGWFPMGPRVHTSATMKSKDTDTHVSHGVW